MISWASLKLPYAYSMIGNMTSKEGISYTYPTSGNPRPHAVTATSDGKTYVYDANGNMTTDGLRTIAYDYDNMPSSVTMGATTTSFIYDASGQRVKKVTPTATTVYVGKLYECTNGSCTKYIMAGGNRVAWKNSAGTFYYHQDHLGSSRVITDASGTKAEEITYLPYGATLTDSGNGTVSVEHRFTSQEFDAETGLYYYNARYYNPALGRFISADSMIPNPRDPQDLNRYTYAGNNPLLYTDPTGHFKLGKVLRKFTDTIVAGTIGFIAGGPVGAAAAIASNIAVAHTGEGRKLTASVANHVFDDALGIDHPRTAYMLASATLQIGLAYGINSAYYAMSGGQASYTGSDKYFEVDPRLYFQSPNGQGTLVADASGRVGASPLHWCTTGVLCGPDNVPIGEIGIEADPLIAPVPPMAAIKNVAGKAAKEIVFQSQHGARHLIGTGLSANQVEGAIGKALQVTLKNTSETGSFWGRIIVQGKEIEYRAYTIGPDKINIGTYYPTGR